MQSPRVTSPQAPPVTPVPPAPPVSPSAAIPGGASGPGQLIQIPLSGREIAAIRARRSELSNQLTSAEGRRENLVQQLEDATGANRAGIEQRIELLDKRILQLETDIAETGRQLTSAPAGEAAVAARGPGGGRNFDFNSENVAIMSGLVTIFVFFPLAVGAARLMWRRARLPVAPPGWADASQRLERMEQAMDTIAIEMERVSEGQRFTTKLLTQRVSSLDGSGAAEDPSVKALGAGPAEPIQINQKQAARVPHN